MVTILEMAVDSRGVKVGLAEANRALDETAKKADKAEKEVTQLGDKSKTAGRNMSAAFAATGGGLAVTHGLAGMSDGFRRGSASMTAFAASQALLDMGRMAEDMKGVTSATGGTMSVFSKLGMVMKAHPIMTIATVLAGAASMMQVFGGETEEAATEMDRLAAAMEKVRVGREAAQLLGISQLSPAQQARQNVRGAAEAYSGGQGQTYGGMARMLGKSVGEVLAIQRGAMGGGPIGERRPVRRMIGGRDQIVMEPVPVAQQRVTRDAAKAILRTLYQQLEAEVETLKPGASTAARAGVTGAGVTGAGRGGLPPLAPGQMGGAYNPTFNQLYGEEYGTGAMLTRTDQAMDKANQEMDELLRKGQQLGSTLGDAFFNVVSGAATAKQIMASIVADMARQGFRQGFAGLFGEFGQSFGKTPAQAKEDT
jgi:uncharacterized coiled-coil protein SlyX